MRALAAGLVQARDDGDIRAVVIVGSGDAFSAGADLHSFIEPGPPLAQALERRELGSLFLLMDCFPKPLVAAVNGDALGAGFGLVAACHLAVASMTARFGLPGVRLGIMPLTIMPAVFRTIPRKLGLELMLTGRLMPAGEALTAGFINATVDPAGVVDAGIELAASAATGVLTTLVR